MVSLAHSSHTAGRDNSCSHQQAEGSSEHEGHGERGLCSAPHRYSLSSSWNCLNAFTWSDVIVFTF